MKKVAVAFALLLIVIVAASAFLRSREPGPPPLNSTSAPPREPRGVGCRGRIEPEDGILIVAAPYVGGNPSIVSELRVKEGAWVQAGQEIAKLEGWRSSEKVLRQSEAEVEVARKKLALVRAGSKPADLDTQRMEIARWESEYAVSLSEFQRYEKLQQEGLVSASTLDQQRLGMDRNKRILDAARERLKSLEDVRHEDVEVQEAQLAAAMAEGERAKTDLNQFVVRAPVSGRVLAIRAHAGEEASTRGILELAKTNRMYVIGEVYESDIGRVHPGQKAVISGDLVPGGLTGSVAEISHQVTKVELLSLHPADFAHSRVVKVKILLDDNERVAGLIHGIVNVEIQP